MKKHTLLFLSLAAIGMARTEIIDNLEDTGHIILSRTDANRLVFPYQIKQEIDSKEKDLMVSVVGKEIFIKFMPYKKQDITQQQGGVQGGNKEQVKDTVNGEKIIYDESKPAEIFIVTEKKTYSLIVYPKDVETTTVYFNETFEKKKEDIFINKDAEYVDNIANNILKPIMANPEIALDGFEKTTINTGFSPIFLPELNTNILLGHSRTYKGYRYQVDEYELRNPSRFAMTIPNTKEFLRSIIGQDKKKIIAYSMYYGNRTYKIFPSQSAKLLIVSEVLNDKDI